MSDPRETLTRIRARADAATEGPWEHGQCEPCGGRGRLDVTIWGRRGNALVASWCDDDEFNSADVEFIAAARTTVPALVDALEAVLELHRPVGEEVIPWDCAEGDCDHEDDEHPLDTVTLCGECYRLAVEVSPYYGENGCSTVLWPCPTVKAITDALDTNH